MQLPGTGLLLAQPPQAWLGLTENHAWLSCHTISASMQLVSAAGELGLLELGATPDPVTGVLTYTIVPCHNTRMYVLTPVGR